MGQLEDCDWEDSSASLVEKAAAPVPASRQSWKLGFAMLLFLSALAGIGLLLARSSRQDPFLGVDEVHHGKSFIVLEGENEKKENENENGEKTEKKEEAPAPPPPPAQVPGGATIILSGVTGKMTDLFVKSTKKSKRVSIQNADKEIHWFLSSNNLVESSDKCGRCGAGSGKGKTEARECCLEWYSGDTAIRVQSLSGQNLKDIPNLIAFVKLTYEDLMEPDLVKYERSLPLAAAQRKKFCAKLKEKKVFSSKVLQATDMKDVFNATGIEPGPSLDAANTLTAQEQTAAADPSGAALEKFKKQQEFTEAAKDAQKTIDESIAKAKEQMAEAKKQASSMHDESAQKAAAALKEATQEATKSLETMKSRLSSLELGKADLQAGADSLKKLATVTNNGKLAKGTKLNSKQLISQNRIFAGRYFEQGVSQGRDMELVVEFSQAFLSKLPAPAPPPKVAATSLSSTFFSTAPAAKMKAPVDVIANLVMSNPEDSTTEYSRQTTSSTDARAAARLVSSYGSSASNYVQQDSAGGLNIGIPGILSVGAQYAQKSSESSASSKQKDKEASNSWSNTSHEFHQVTLYEEPKAVIDVAPSMVQTTPEFLKAVRHIQSNGHLSMEQGADLLFERFGTHVCLQVTLGGSWTIRADATSTTAESIQTLAEATSEVTSKQKSAGSSIGASGAATIITSYGPVTVGASGGVNSGSSEAAETKTSSGSATKTGNSGRNVFVQTNQNWKGGLSGGSASDWRLSLQPDQNSNWRIISRRFEDCTPIWYFLRSDNSYANKLCNYWFRKEIQGYNSKILDDKLKGDLLMRVPLKCKIEPESTRPGVFAEALESAKDRAVQKAQEELYAAQGKVKQTEVQIALAEDQYQISKEIEVGIPSDGDWNWGHALRSFQKRCQDDGWKFGFPTHKKGGTKYGGYCVKGHSFHKFDFLGSYPVDEQWNNMRGHADWKCKGEKHMYGGFADGNEQAGGDRGVVCFNQVRGRSIKTFSMDERVKQSPGWWAIAEQAADWCKRKKYKTGMPSTANSNGDNAHNYCFEYNNKVVEDLTTSLKNQKDIVAAKKKVLESMKR